MKKIWDWVKVALGIVFSVIVYVFFTRRDNSKLKEKIEEVKIEAKKQKVIVKEIEKRMESRKEKAKTLAERLKKHFNILIVFCIVFSLGIVGVTSPTIDKLIVPDTYSELVIAYEDMAEIAIAYQELYNKAEADNQTLLEVTKNLQALIKTQQEIIDKLLKRNSLGIFAGVNYVPLNPSYSGIIGGVTFEF